MLRVSTLLVAFCLLLFGAHACDLTVWTDGGFQGQTTIYKDNVNDLPSTFAKSISSLRVSDGCGVTVYKKANFNGERSFFEGKIMELRPYGLNDEITSFQLHDLRTIECGVVMYSDSHFGGTAHLYVAAHGHLSSFSYGVDGQGGLIYSDYYSSLKIVGYNGGRCAVVAWENTGLRGDNRYFGGPEHNSFGNFNDAISSMAIVFKNECAVVFYTDSEYRGNARYYTSTANHLAGGQNDMFSSMKLLGKRSPPCKLRAYKNADQNGDSFAYVGPIDVPQLSMNDAVSSFTLETTTHIWM